MSVKGHTILRFGFRVGIALCLILCTVGQQSAAQSLNALPISNNQSASSHETPADLKKGQRVFEKSCVNCHGVSGKGDGPIGRALIPPAADLTVLGNKSDKEVLDTIRNGRPGTAMPSWKNDLSPQEIMNVLAYIRTLGP